MLREPLKKLALRDLTLRVGCGREGRGKSKSLSKSEGPCVNFHRHSPSPATTLCSLKTLCTECRLSSLCVASWLRRERSHRMRRCRAKVAAAISARRQAKVSCATSLLLPLRAPQSSFDLKTLAHFRSQDTLKHHAEHHLRSSRLVHASQV